VGYPWGPVRAIVLPVKSLSESKTRLSAVLSTLERGALTLAMLEDVMDATQSLTGWETWVVSPDEVVLVFQILYRIHNFRLMIRHFTPFFRPQTPFAFEKRPPKGASDRMRLGWVVWKNGSFIVYIIRHLRVTTSFAAR
jgi:hypothetical protein